MRAIRTLREEHILYENGRYWVAKATKGYEVYQTGVTHSRRCAIIGSDGPEWFARAKAEADRRAAFDTLPTLAPTPK